ncbi:uncharacterized protein EDB91DRAFT_533092 [Suillus paluster]|uniref:uncharacterized protein n=1 Tax=Suillus paluster TaxID=48578 RepID=UPI001B87D48C|nr:uncharacterized protein EDB91DRAFT_533092 [Suillus paluster]KAG1752737.1 hypothetical protein EDB91DRAFT_533092 [Suillus paluster]
MSISLLLNLFLLPSRAYATLEPESPGPGDVFRSGSSCVIEWNTNLTQPWDDVAIDLMSGSNLNMSKVTTVVGHLDGTDPTLTPFNWICPDVMPNSAIYFYQFTNKKDLTGSKWTSRFTIASESGATTLPENSKQPGGDPIPWGNGRLASSNSTVPSNASISPSSHPSPTHSCETLKCTKFLRNASSSDTQNPSTPPPLRQRTVSRPTALHPVNFTQKTRPASRGSRGGPTLGVHFLCALATLWLIVL